MSTTRDAPPAYGDRFDDSPGEESPGTGRAAERERGTADGDGAGAARAAQELRRTAADAADRPLRPDDELAEMLDQNLRKVREYIEKNPVQSAAIAFAAGIVLSSLLRR